MEGLGGAVVVLRDGGGGDDDGGLERVGLQVEPQILWESSNCITHQRSTW